MEIEYKIKTALQSDIYEQLNYCNNNFIPPLNTRLDLSDYSNKIYEKAITFEAWKESNLVGILCAYFNDFENRIAFITSLCILNEYSGRGIAKQLMTICSDYAKGNNFKCIRLEVAKENTKAINLYSSFNYATIKDMGTGFIMECIIE